MPDLTIIVPSRGRPANAIRLVEAFRDTCTADTSLYFVNDEDDPTLDDYRGVNGAIIPRQGTGMAGALNTAALGHARAPDAPFAVGFMGDDHLPRTKGWDEAYLNALDALDTGMVYGNDLLQGQTMPTQIAMTTDIVRALGWMSPPGLKHLFIDIVWLELGRRLDRITYLPDVVVEHLHPANGKAVEDDRYIEVNSQTMIRDDGATYQAWLAQVDVDVERVRAACGL